MSNHLSNYNAANFLEQLTGKGYTKDDELSDFVVSQQQEQELPLYLRVLIGVGAFISSLFFIGFLSVADIIHYRQEMGLIIWGLVFVVGAIGLQRMAGNDCTVKHSFLIQSSFSAMAVGKSLFFFGFAQLLDSGWGATIALLTITMLTYPIYRMSIDRFLSSFAVLYSILANIFWNDDINGYREYLLNGFFLLQFAAATILLTHGKIKRDYIPLAYAFTFSLCISVLTVAAHVEFGYGANKELVDPTLINVILTGGLIMLIGWAAGGVEKMKHKALILATVGAALLGLISAPGLILALSLMVLGYAMHDRLLMALGALLIPVFLVLYYYNLDISLMQKSGILVSSGAILLLGRFYLQYQGWDKGGISCVQK